jgi:hypothetical protein
MDVIQREEYPSLKWRSRLAVYPELKHSGRALQPQVGAPALSAGLGFGTSGRVCSAALIAAMNAWVLDKAKPLGQNLVEQNALRADQHGALEVLVNLHLEQHGDDVEKSVRFGIAST